MYLIKRNKNNSYDCFVTIQDSTETFNEQTLDTAIQSVIKSARLYNHDYINKKDITIINEIEEISNKNNNVSDKDIELLNKIKNGYLKVLNYDNPILRYRITEEECEIIQKIREGDLIIISKS